ncbi:MAG: hypothetical protein H6861_10220 [Rhodospirillales bacterium]|nr:hypothetical protein [Rhodospirillales bacterium]
MDKSTKVMGGILGVYALASAVGAIMQGAEDNCDLYARENKITIQSAFESQVKSGSEMRHVSEKRSFLGLPHYCVVTPGGVSPQFTPDAE